MAKRCEEGYNLLLRFAGGANVAARLMARDKLVIFSSKCDARRWRLALRGLPVADLAGYAANATIDFLPEVLLTK